MAANQPLRTQPALSGKTVYLRPASAEDIANTYHWFVQCDPASQTCRPLTVQTAAEAAEAFKKAERSLYRQQFMVVTQKDNTPVGKASFFDLNTLNRSAEIGLLIDPDRQRKGFGQAAVHLLCQYLFDVRGLNKVHAQTGSFNVAAVKMLERCKFRRDGILRRHYFYDGEFHDGYVYSILQHEFD